MTETERLILKPLTFEQLKKYIRLDNSLEIELNLNKTSRVISPELKEALEETILPNVADTSKNYLFSTLWTVISKDENKMVGDLCFVGEPDTEGEVEIGYGTYPEFRKRGFMTEAVAEIIKWAEKQPDIRSIIASTEKSNIDSYSILERNNFIKFGETETLYNWRLRIKK
jgi:RimJ/RimL family protein N-acetyltransferase